MTTLRNCHCGNCNWTGDEAELATPLDLTPGLNIRLDAGATVPAGECPECGALAYLVPDNPAVVLVGNPIDGLAIVGPFPSIADGCEWAEANCDHANWTVTSVQTTTQFEEN